MIEPALPGRRIGGGWQLIFADLALILFLVTLSALPATEPGRAQPRRPQDADADPSGVKIAYEVAAAQALYRPVAGGPSLGAWLASQPHDPRATLTVFVTYRPGEEQQAWQQAETLSAEARSKGTAVRTIITAGTASEAYASLAYDAVIGRGSI